MKILKTEITQISLKTKEFTTCQVDVLFSLLLAMKESDSNIRNYSFTIAEIERLTGRNWSWNELQEATERIGSRMIVIETDEFLKQMWAFSRVLFMKDKSYFTIYLNPDSRPYLIRLKSKINTIPELKQIVYLKDPPTGEKRPN